MYATDFGFRGNSLRMETDPLQELTVAVCAARV